MLMSDRESRKILTSPVEFSQRRLPFAACFDRSFLSSVRLPSEQVATPERRWTILPSLFLFLSRGALPFFSLPYVGLAETCLPKVVCSDLRSAIGISLGSCPLDKRPPEINPSSAKTSRRDKVSASESARATLRTTNDKRDRGT